MRFAIKGKVYEVVDIENVTMRDMLLFEQQTEAFGRPLTWGDVKRWQAELEALPDDEARTQHPCMMWLTATAVWIARRMAGEDVTFAQAVDIPVSDITFLPDAKDHQPKKKTAGKARKPRAGSAQGANPAAAQTPSAEL